VPVASTKFEKVSFYEVFGGLGFKKLSFYKVVGGLGFKTTLAL